MIKSKDTTSSQELSEIIVKGIQEKKGTEIVILNLKEVGNAIADFFVICTGNSDSQIDAIKESIEKEVFLATQQNPWHTEGHQNKQWVLLDYVDVVVHVFKKDLRHVFSLEELWGDAALTYVDEAR
ncbi:MAG: ribosome silencing factor [Cyclobacteriaceae bacterium]